MSSLVSLKSVLVVALLGGSLLFAVLSLDAPAWRRWTSTTADTADGDQPSPFRVPGDEALPLGPTEPPLEEAFDEDAADSAEAGADENGGALLALALTDADDEESSAVEQAIGEDAEEQTIAPVFWGEAQREREPAREDFGDVAADEAEAPAEPGLLMVDPDTGAPLADVAIETEGGSLSRDRFSALEDRLRELGANRYRLETWGAEGELFRFRCWMAVSDTERYNRFFEATDPDALAAFEKVLAEVEQWRARQVRGQ